jgi:hypothetical protein
MYVCVRVSVSDRPFPHVRSVETDTSNIHIHDRSFPGVRSGETDTSSIHIHDRSFPRVILILSTVSLLNFGNVPTMLYCFS